MMHLRHIKEATAQVYGIKTEDLTGPSRQLVFARPRQLAMSIARAETKESLPDIGRAFGGRDHTTVMHAVSVVSQRMGPDVRSDRRKILEAVETIKERELGGVFRSVRADQPQFKSVRKVQ